MSFRVRRSLPVWLAAASLLIGTSGVLARDSYRRPAQLEPLHHDNDHEIIFEMEPLHPVRQSIAPVKAASAAKQTETAGKAAPAKSAQRPANSAPAAAAAPAATASKSQPETPKIETPKIETPAVDAAKASTAAPPAQAEAPKPVDVAKPGEVGHMAITPPPAATSAPESAAAPAADATQPTPLPLDQALAPAETGAPEKASAPPVAEAAPPVATAAPVAAQPAEGQAEAAEAPKTENAAPAPAEQPAPTHVDTAAQITALMSKGVKGPVEVRIADRATMFLPAGRTFIADDTARELAKAAGFDWRPSMRGLIVPTGEKLEWLAPVEVLEDGYIKSDAGFDADKLLGAFSAGLPEVNALRAKSGQPAVELAGWLSAPALDEKHRLSACVNVMTQGGDDKYFNCEAWALGRDGAIKVSLAEGGESGERLKGEAKAIADTIVYDHGKTYEEIDLAADKVAPYVASDMLTSDVSAKVPPSAPAEGGSSLIDWIGMVLVAAAAVAIGAMLLRRRSTGEPDAPKGVAPTSPADDAPASLFAKLLPSLHAKFNKQGDAARPAHNASKKPVTDDAGGSLLSKLPGLRNKSTKDAQEPAGAPVMDDADAASALQKLATRMRRSAPEESLPEVDVSRVLRASARPLPGAAPEPAAEAPASVEPAAPKAAAPAPAAPARESARSLAELDESFGLVEPGDPEATSAAMHAREALRQANG